MVAVINVNSSGFSFGDIAYAWDYFDEVRTKTATKYVIQNTIYDNSIGNYVYTADKIEIFGKNLTYDGNALASGKINTIKFYAEDGTIAWSITGLSLNAKAFGDAAYWSNYSSFGDLRDVFATTQIKLNGGVSAEIFRGGQMNDTINGGLGSDTLTGGDGDDILSGGGKSSASPLDIDTLDYSYESGGGGAVAVNFKTGKATDTFGGTDKISGFESVIGTDNDDKFTASDANTYQEFIGGDGNDTIIGGKGLYDTVRFGSYVSIDLDSNGSGSAVTGYDGTDYLSKINGIIGSDSGDTIIGSSAREIFTGGDARDFLNGEGGIDTLDYAKEDGDYGIAVKLSNTYARDSYGYYDTISNFENVIGTAHDDYITGGNSANRLEGGDGNDSLRGAEGKDVLIGGNGHDRLEGGTGKDTLSGGEGSDVFVFNTKLSASTNVDLILGFSSSDDTIYLENSIFTKLGGPGALSSTKFYANTSGNAHDSSDRIVYEKDTGEIYYDTNGSAGGGSVLIAILKGHPALQASDFIII